MGFNFVNLAITVRANDAVSLKNYLPILGKEFAEACRSLSCRWPDRECDSCSAQDVCNWFFVFGQKLSPDPAALKRHQKPPLPFVFSFSWLDFPAEAHNDIVIGLIVVGRAIQQLDLLLNGFAALMSSGMSPVSAEITSIECRDYQGAVQANAHDTGVLRSGYLIPKNLAIVSTEGLMESRTWTGSNLQIQLLSPLRFFENSRPVVRFEFSRFARSVMRRVSSLAYYYGENEFDCDFKEISRQIEDVICTDDHFIYKGDKNKRISGITGYGSFLGDFGRLEQFLVIGSYVHAGKGSTFGMGGYKVVPCGDS
jgi:hypothetical protein